MPEEKVINAKMSDFHDPESDPEESANEDLQNEENLDDESAADEDYEGSDNEDAESGDNEGEDQEAEFYENEAEYLKEFDLPGNLESVEGLADSYKSMLAEMKRLQTENQTLKNVGATPAQDPLKSGLKETGGTPEKLFGKDLMIEHVKKLAESGQISGDNAAAYEHMARVNDAVLNPVLEKFEQYFNLLAKGLNHTMTGTRNMAWKDFQHKKLIDRKEADKIMDQHGLSSYDEALPFMALTNPELLTAVAQNAQKRGFERGKKLKLKRSKTLRPGKGGRSGKPGLNISKYQNPDGSPNRDMLNGMPIEQQKKIVDAIYSKVVKKKR